MILLTISCGIEVEVSACLKGESCIWIFSRSDPKIDFDKYTTIIKISKEDTSQKVFCSLGTFVYDVRGVKVLKTFMRRQLIDSIKNMPRNYVEEDCCNITLSLFDSGEDKIVSRIYCK